MPGIQMSYMNELTIEGVNIPLFLVSIPKDNKRKKEQNESSKN